MQRQIALLLSAILILATSILAQEVRPARPEPASRPALPPATHVDVKYGPHERNVMDVWLAKSDKPTPVVVSIHGGGFLGGNKLIIPRLLNEYLANGISVVAITYRYSSQAIAPAPMRDGARAIQFIRTKAQKWNIDPTRIAATGNSAGAGISLWCAFHEDLAEPNNEDPVLRQSSRVKCVISVNGQPSYDPRFIKALFPEFKVYEHPALGKLFGGQPEDPDTAPKSQTDLYTEASALPHLTKDDPPVMMQYNTTLDTPVTDESIGIHHPRLGKALKDKMDALGIESVLITGGQRPAEALVFIKKHLEVK